MMLVWAKDRTKRFAPGRKWPQNGKNTIVIEHTAERVCTDLVFPEGPRWHDGKLWFSDFIDQRIATLDPETGNVETHIQLDDSPSGLGWTACGSAG